MFLKGNMQTFSNLILIISSVLLNCVAQILIRKGMLSIGEISINFRQLYLHIGEMLVNVYLWISVICYFLSFIIWMLVLSKVEVSFAYPFLSIGYVVTAFAGYWLLGESLSVMRIVGILVICIGVYLISRG